MQCLGTFQIRFVLTARRSDGALVLDAMEMGGKILPVIQVCAVAFSGTIKSMEPTVQGVHQPFCAFVANTTQFQAIAQVKCAVIAKKSGADVLAVKLAKETNCASEMETINRTLKLGAESVLILGLVHHARSVLLRFPVYPRTQHALIVYMLLLRS